MKKSLTIVGIVVAVFLLTLVSVQERIIKLGGSGNRVLRNSTGESQGSMFGEGGTGLDNYNTTASVYIPGFSIDSGRGLNYLELLDHTLRSGEGDKWKQTLMKFYVESYQGHYKSDSLTHSAPPRLLASAHFNESNYSSFLKNEILAGKAVNGIVPTLQNLSEEVVKQVLGVSSLMPSPPGRSSDGSVWTVINNTHQGPYMVDSPTSKKWVDAIAKNSSKSTFDVYSFRDSSNTQSIHYSEAEQKYGGFGASENVLCGAAGIIHNRGSMNQFVSGTPYNQSETKWVTDLADEKRNEEEYVILRTLTEAFGNYNIPMVPYHYGGMSTDSCRALALMILLKEGWLLELGSNGIAPINKALTDWYEFPDNENPAKLLHGWETLAEAKDALQVLGSRSPASRLGMSDSEANKIYGWTSGSIVKSFPSTFTTMRNYPVMYRIGNPVEGYYKTGNAKRVMYLDYISAGYVIQCGPVSEALYVQFCLDAGMPREIDGNTVDPTNPHRYYTKVANTYNPMTGGVADNLNEMIKLMGMTPSTYQYYALLESYKMLGTPYTQEGFNSWWDNHTGKWYQGKDSDGKKIDTSKWKPASNYYGKRQNDCSTFASITASLGLSESSSGSLTKRGENGWVQYQGRSGDWIGFVGQSRTVNYMGKDVDVTLVPLDISGSPLTQYYKTSGWTNSSSSNHAQKLTDWAEVLQPGDIVAVEGHAQVFFGRNLTDNDVRLPPEWTYNTDYLTVKKGAGCWMNQGSSSRLSRICNSNASDSKKYRAYRLAANVPGLG